MAFEDLQKRGQELYRQKKYEEAFECFNAVITQKGRDYVAALDNRAATYTKLGNLQMALRDGRLMIQEERVSCLGYLRTGKVLQLLGNDVVALSIYNYGLRNVPNDNPHFKLLQGMHDRLSKRYSPPKSVDPLLVLPLELAELIMQYLSFRQVVGLLRVSKSWRRYLENTPSLWSELDFSVASKPVTIGALRSYIKRSKGTTTQAVLHRFNTSQQNDVLKFITTRCKDLNSLTIPSGFTGASLISAAPYATNLKTLIVMQASEVTLDTISQVISQCNNLVRVEFHCILRGRFPATWTGDMTKIRTLTLNANYGCELAGGQLNLNILLKKIPNVCNLSLQYWGPLRPMQYLDFSSLNQLQFLNLTKMSLVVFPIFPSSLQKLVMISCSSCDFDSTASQANIVNNNLTNLTKLFLGGHPYSLKTDHLQMLLEPNKGNLEELDVEGCYGLGTPGLISLGRSGYLKKIVSLNLGQEDFVDRCLESLVEHVPRLRKMALVNAGITGVGVKAAVQKPQDKLEHLVLRNCSQVSPDAVEYARARGVKVHCYFPDATSKGKRVRLD